MAMAPFPVSILVAPMGSHVLVMAPVVVGEIDAPSMVLTVIPVVIVLVVPIVNSDLHGGAFGRGNSHSRQWARHDSSQ